MNPASQDIKDMLLDESALGLSFSGNDGNLSIGRMEEYPDDLVTIFDLPGRKPQLTLKQGENYFYDSIQIRVRSHDYLTGYALANSIMLSLHGRAQETWNGTLYSVIYCSTGPAMLKWDDNNRVIFITNFEIQRR